MQNEEKMLTSILDRLSSLEERFEGLEKTLDTSKRVIRHVNKRCLERGEKITNSTESDIAKLRNIIDQKLDTNGLMSILKLYHEGKLPL